MPETDILLEDLLTGHVQDLRITPGYSFEAEINQDPNRFLIHFNPITTQINDPDVNSVINIYSWSNEIYIVTDDEESWKKGIIFIEYLRRERKIKMVIENGRS